MVCSINPHDFYQLIVKYVNNSLSSLKLFADFAAFISSSAFFAIHLFIGTVCGQILEVGYKTLMAEY